MKALTLWRPWGFAFPPKDIENRKKRPWPSIIGERIALHEGNHYDYEGAKLIKDILGITEIPERRAGMIVATTRVVGWIQIEKDPVHGILIKKTSEMPPRVIAKAAASRWLLGPFCWVVEDTFVLPSPVPCKGAQGLWAPPPAALAELERQEKLR